MSDWKNKLIFGDNLGIMQGFPDEYVDLIYLDPPFNSQANYNVLFKEANGSASEALIHAFSDTWHWDMKSLETYEWLVENGPGKLPELLETLRGFLGSNDMMAYLTMMAVRLVEMRRVLKKSGSIYLHCDPTASHYLKLVMDSIFGYKNFLNELIWYYRGAGTPNREYARRHDVLLFYAKKRGNQSFDPDPIRQPYAEATKERFSHYIGNVRGGRDFGEQELNPLGKHPDDVITHIQPIAPSAKARLGYPTQKPEPLLEHIINASCPENGIVLDPFCGCGTTIAVAEQLNRKWIGIDLTYIAVNLMRYRLNDTFGERLQPYEVIGIPNDLKSAEALAIEDEHSGRYQFQWWALSLVNARPVGGEKKKGADKGKDGLIRFFDDTSGKSKTIVVSVKSGNVGAKDVRDLIGAVNNSKAEMGCLLTLRPSTKSMRDAATEAGFYEQTALGKKVPQIQVLTVEGLLDGSESLTYRKLQDTTFQQAPKAETEEQKEGLF